MLQKWSCNFHSNCEITLWTLMDQLLRSTTLDESGENTTNTFFHWNVCLFFKNLCFQQLLRCNRIIPITSKAIVKIGCGYSQIRPWGLSHSRMREKTGQKLFFTGKFAFFSKVCVFNNFLGVTELILYIPQYLSKYFVDPYNVLTEVCHTPECAKKMAKIFSPLDYLLFFQKVVFSSIS